MHQIDHDDHLIVVEHDIETVMNQTKITNLILTFSKQSEKVRIINLAEKNQLSSTMTMLSCEDDDGYKSQKKYSLNSHFLTLFRESENHKSQI